MKKFLVFLTVFLAAANPSAVLATTYIVKSGDTLSALAREFDTTVDQLALANGIQNKNLIYVGQRLNVGEMSFGAAAGYTPITGYESRTTQYITGSASTIPVASTKDPSGQQIVLSNISPSSSVSVYMSLEPGTTREEPIRCSGVTATSWTSCVRGLPFQGGSEVASSTLQKAHNAGSKIIITNIGQFYNQYVNIDGNQYVSGVKTFDSFPGTSSTTALPNANNQFVTKYYADTVVSTGFTSANIDLTQGLKAAGTAPEKVQVSTSSTGSTAIDTAGRLYVNPTFNQPSTFNSTLTINGATTATRSLQVPSPTSTGDAVNLGYLNNAIVFGTSTGTAGIAITAGNALFISATSTLFKTNSSVASSTYQYVGIALNSGASSSVITYARPGFTSCNFTGLTPGYSYYLNGTAGQVDTTAGTFFAKIGIATSANCIALSSPKFIRTGSLATPSATTYFQEVGFYPAHITVRGSSGTSGLSIGDDTNSCVQQGAGALTYQSSAWYIYNAGIKNAGTISSKSATGFIATVSNATAAGQIEWVAYSE